MNSLVQYKSSAGSGKTFRLVMEYLKIVIANPFAYRHILAITFTNKATDEMKTRIIETLSELASLDGQSLRDHPYYEELSKSLKGRTLSISGQARKALNLILGDYSNFSVSTIESFFQRVIRAFAKELNIPLGYEVDMRQDITLDHIVTATFKEVGESGSALTRLLGEFLEVKMEEEKGWKIENEIKRIGKEVFKEKYQDLLVEFEEGGDKEDRLKLIREFSRSLFLIRSDFESQMAEIGVAAQAILENYSLETRDFSRGQTGPAGYFNKIQNPTKPEDFAPNSYVYKALEDPEAWYSKTSRLKSTIDAAVAKGLGELLEKAEALYRSKYRDYLTARVVSRTLHSFGVMNDLQKKLVDYRLENNRIIISDTNYLLKQVVSRHYDAPFVYEKVGTRYEYYLIDEFQDTSDMQWNNLFPLVYNVLALGSDSLIVGDVKQSIYRWRNGNMELLMREVEEQLNRYGQHVETRPLINNWRTAHRIVAFNNEFFKQGAGLLAGEFEGEASRLILEAYEEVAQAPKRMESEGYVSAEFFSRLDENGAKKRSAWKPKAMDRMEGIIRECLADNFLPGDIAVLVRSNHEGVEVAEYLQQLQDPISVVSAESLKIHRHPRVRFLLAVLHFLNQEENAVNRAMVSYYHQVLEGQEPVVDHHTFAGHGIPAKLENRRTLLRKLPVYECLERIRTLFPALKEPNGYVEAFLNETLAYSSQQEASISGFLDHWEDSREDLAISSAEESGSVRIMTIHKAKGLEFPVVILPFASWDFAPKSGGILWVKPTLPPYDQFSFLPVEISSKLESTHFHEEYARERLMSYLDNLNMLYVAFTRPKYRLYVLGPDDEISPGKKITHCGMLISRLLDGNLVRGEVTRDPVKRFVAGSTDQRPPDKDKGKGDVQTVDPLSSPLEDWNAIVRIRFGSNRYLKSGIIERNEKILAGELLHEALARVITPDDIPDAVDEMQYQGLLDPASREGFTRLIEETVNHPEARSWFEPGWIVKNEAEILTPHKGVLRPDRVLVRQDHAIVIDYKTGKEKESHNAQIKAYMEALKQVGYARVEGYIYYTSKKNIIRID